MKLRDWVFMGLVGGLAYYSENLFRAIVVLSIYGIVVKADDHKQILGLLMEKKNKLKKKVKK